MNIFIIVLLLIPILGFSTSNQEFLDALATGSPKIIQQYIDKGEYPNQIDFRTGYSPLLITLIEGNTPAAITLINNKAKINFISEDQHTALIFSAKYGHTKVVDLLIKNSANINFTNDQGSALNYAAKYGFVPIINSLLRAGADINNINIDLHTPLMQASCNGHQKAVQLLLTNNANLSFFDQQGYSAF